MSDILRQPEPIKIESARDAGWTTMGMSNFSGLFWVPDNLMLNVFVDKVGRAFALDRNREYIPKRAADYAHPNPRHGQFSDITLEINETIPEDSVVPELNISFSGLLKVGRRKAAHVKSELAIYGVRGLRKQLPTDMCRSFAFEDLLAIEKELSGDLSANDAKTTVKDINHFTLRSMSRAYVEVFDDEALTPGAYKAIKREVIPFSCLAEEPTYTPQYDLGSEG